MLDDPDLYIDKVDHQCKVDPELVAELDSVGLPFEDDNSAPATGWTNAEADKCTQNGSGNWDIFIEKPAEVNKWESEANLTPNTTWGGQANIVTPETVWGGQSSNKWGNNGNTSWDAPLEKPSWGGWGKNHYTPNNWNNNFHGGPSNNRYQQLEDPSHTSGAGRKRNGGGGGGGGGYFKQRNQDEHQQQRSSGWQQDHRGRNRQWRPVHNRAA